MVNYSASSSAMSNDRTSWGEFSEFLNDEEFDGRRLAEFLQKKKRATQPLRRVFDGYEPEKCSLKVNIKRLSPPKIPTPLPATTVTSAVQQIGSHNSNINNANVNGGETVANEKVVTAAEIPALEEENDAAALNAPRSPVKSPKSPRLRPMIQNGGKLSDRLRRQALVRRSLQGGVNRALLTDFESTLTDDTQDFRPAVHSTPISQETEGHANSPIKGPPKLSATQHAAADMNVSPNIMSCNQLESVVESVVERMLHRLSLHNCSNDSNPMPAAFPQSPSAHATAPLHKRSFTVEKGIQPGQEIMTPLSPPRQHMPSMSVTPPAVTRSSRTISDKSLLVSNTPLAQHDTSAAVPSNHVEIPETQTPQKHVQSTPVISMPFNVYQTFHGDPPRDSTQVNRIASTLITIAKEQGTPVVEVSTPRREQSIQRTEIAATPIHDKSKETRSEKVNESERHPQQGAAATEPMSDIITDDSDDDTPLPHCRITRQQELPLNLAGSRSKQAPLATRSQRLLKRPKTRSTRRQDYLPSSLSDTDNEVGPPRAHPLLVRRVSQWPSGDERRRVLNKAPNTPINGEKFAAELRRLTNGEILDLRKRSSLGKLFAISGRKSNGGGAQEQQEAEQLEQQLVAEIVKRNLQHVELADDNSSHNDIDNIDDDLLLSILEVPLPQAPQQFQDSVERSIAAETAAVVTRKTASKVALTASAATEPETEIAENVAAVSEDPTALPLPAEDCSESVLLNPPVEFDPLIDEIGGRLTFVTQTDTTMKRNVKRQKYMSEEIKNYINVKKQVRNRRRKNSAMRSLYSKGDSVDTDEGRNCSRSSLEQTGPQPRRTPSHSSLSIELRIVSPPPPMNESLTRRRQSTRFNGEANVEALPPPATFSNQAFKLTSVDSDGASTSAAATKDGNQTPAATDATCFKMPQKPAPPRKKSLTRHRQSTRFSGEVNVEALPPPATFSNQAFESTSVVSDDASTTVAATRGGKKTPAATDATCFKIPQKPAPKTRKKKGSNSPAGQSGSQPSKLSTSDAADATSSNLRRSKRSHTQPPLNNLFQSLYRSVMDRNNRSRTARTQKASSISACAGLPIASSTATSLAETGRRQNRVKIKRSHSRATKATAASLAAPAPTPTLLGETDTTGSTSLTVVGGDRNRVGVVEECPPTLRGPINAYLKLPTIVEPHSESDEQVDEAEAHESRMAPVLEHSRIRMRPTPVDQLNDMFDKLKGGANAPAAASQSSSTKSADLDPGSSAKKKKKLRVRLKRMHHIDQTSTSASSSCANTPSQCRNKDSRDGHAEASSKAGGSSANPELLAWLKGISDMQSTNGSNKIFKEMGFSAAGNLIFADLEGIDYAFYDTDDVGSMGYLRFKPHQSKPSKRTKKYDLHFVVLSGEFLIDSNSEKGTFCTGDMIIIKKGSRYVMKNMTDDVGLLMVFKK